MQYGVRLRNEPDISYAEFARLVSAIMPETPLGRIVDIRREKDPKIIKKFGPHERRIRSEWRRFLSGRGGLRPIEEAQAFFKAFCDKPRKPLE